MKQRLLGNLAVIEIGFGCMGLDFSYGYRVSREEGINLIRAAVDRGVTFFDTAEVYGPFTNEEMVGEALRPVRDQVVIATKFGFDIDPETGKSRGISSRPENIRGHVERSLKRLGIETVDLIYQLYMSFECARWARLTQISWVACRERRNDLRPVRN